MQQQASTSAGGGASTDQSQADGQTAAGGQSKKKGILKRHSQGSKNKKAMTNDNEKTSTGTDFDWPTASSTKKVRLDSKSSEEDGSDDEENIIKDFKFSKESLKDRSLLTY